jgi:hypothetical protein
VPPPAPPPVTELALPVSSFVDAPPLPVELPPEAVVPRAPLVVADEPPPPVTTLLVATPPVTTLLPPTPVWVAIAVLLSEEVADAPPAVVPPTPLGVTPAGPGSEPQARTNGNARYRKYRAGPRTKPSADGR